MEKMYCESYIDREGKCGVVLSSFIVHKLENKVLLAGFLREFWPLGYKTCFMLSSTEHGFFPAHKCENANNCWHFNIYEQEK